MKCGDIVAFPDQNQYVHRRKLFLVLRFFRWRSPYNGEIFRELATLEFGTSEIWKFRANQLMVVE